MKQTHVRTHKCSFNDPPGPGGRIGGHYFQTCCPYIRPSVRKTKKNTRTAKIKHATPLNGAWWVTLKYFVSCVCVFLMKSVEPTRWKCEFCSIVVLFFFLLTQLFFSQFESIMSHDCRRRPASHAQCFNSRTLWNMSKKRNYKLLEQ